MASTGKSNLDDSRRSMGSPKLKGRGEWMRSLSVYCDDHDANHEVQKQRVVGMKWLKETMRANGRLQQKTRRIHCVAMSPSTADVDMKTKVLRLFLTCLSV